MAVHDHEVLRSFVESEGLFFAYKFPVAAKGAVENSVEGNSDDERSSEISWSSSGSEDEADNSSGRFYSSSGESASSSGRSTGSNIKQLENGDYKSTGSNEEAENEEHIITSEMKRVFDTYDENGDGYICKSELEKFMRKLDVHISEEEISCMIESVDVNGDGYVDFEEFLELHTSLTDSGELGWLGSSADEQDDDEDAELLEAFEVFDKNQDGFISVTELQTVLRNLGINPGVKVQDCQRMISAVDRNNDGQVDFSEFKQLMTGIPCA